MPMITRLEAASLEADRVELHPIIRVRRRVARVEMWISQGRAIQEWNVV